MKDKERDNWDDWARSKLYDFEEATTPEDWEAVASRLSRQVPFYRRPMARHVAAAAVLVALLSLGGLYWLTDRPADEEEVLVEQVAPPSAPASPQRVEPEAERLLPAPSHSWLAVAPDVETRWVEIPSDAEAIELPMAASPENVQPLARVASVGPDAGETRAVRSAFSRRTVEEKRASREERRWQIGLAGGGLPVQSDNSVNRYVTNSDALRSENLLAMNAIEGNVEPSRTDIHHRLPFNVGISASRYLTSRLAVQLGVSYAFLSSDWKTSGIYHTKTEQRLHFIGIPVSLSFTFAEWNRLRFYALAGAKAEVNVAGRQEMRLFSDDHMIAIDESKVRMKEWQWSVNAGLGVSYPLVRFLSLFAEVGGAYYFDNGSAVETIYAERPFNLNLQAGLRFGF